MSELSYTHEEWHEKNDISVKACANCRKAGRILSHEEIFATLTPEEIACGTAPSEDNYDIPSAEWKRDIQEEDMFDDQTDEGDWR